MLTVAGAPYDALLPELAPTSRERVSLQAIKVYFGVAGTVVGLVGSNLMVHQFGFRAMAICIAILALVCRYVGTAGVWSRARLSQPTRASRELGFRAALRATADNRAFRRLLPSIVLFAVAFDLLIGVIPFYAHATIGRHSWLGATTILAVAIGAAVACVPLFALLARCTSKSSAYRISMLAGAVTFPLLGIAGLLPGIPAEIQILIAVALIGAPVSAHYLFPVPLTADVIDDDSGRTAQRREATFLGSTHFVERTATSLAPRPARRRATARRHTRRLTRDPPGRPGRRTAAARRLDQPPELRRAGDRRGPTIAQPTVPPAVAPLLPAPDPA